MQAMYLLIKQNYKCKISISLNVVNTKFMVFHIHKWIVTYPDLHLNGNKIERVTLFKYLS